MKWTTTVNVFILIISILANCVLGKEFPQIGNIDVNVDPLDEWDVAIAIGRQISLLSIRSNRTLNLTIPPPSNVSTKEWESQDLMHLVHNTTSDPNLFFFTQTSKDITTIGVFDKERNETVQLFQSNTSLIDGLAYRAGILYWTDTTLQKIMMMNNTLQSPWGSVPPVEFLNLSGRKVHGLALDPQTGTIYYTIWSLPSTIESFSYESNLTTFILTGLSQPQSLSIYNSVLYFTNRPPGTAFTIESVDLKIEEKKRKVVYKGRYQTPFSIAPICGSSVMWTELQGRSLLIENAAADLDTRTQQRQSTSVIIWKKWTHSIPKGFVVRDGDVEKLSQIVCSLIGKIEKRTDKIDTRTEAPYPGSSSAALTNISGKIRPKSEQCSQEGYCDNGGRCIRLISGEELCVCSDKFYGRKCELFAQAQTQTQSNASTREVVPVSPVWDSPEYITTTSVLSSIIIFLLILSVFLFIKVSKLKQKPKIRRRVFVTSPRNGTELPSYCQMIDIENCCNMNVCETPCYETAATSATTVATAANGKKSKCNNHKEKTDDKQKLIEDV